MGSGGEDWDAQKMLDLYIYDYMKKNNMPEVAEIFAQEADVRDTPPVAEGFLTEWWSIFWDMYSSRMQQNPEPVAESSVQRNNAMENAQQSVHQAAPMPMPGANRQAAPMPMPGANHQAPPMPMPGVNHQAVPMPMADVNHQAGPMTMPDMIHQRAPQVPGANPENMMMGQQPAAYLLAARNYEEEQLPSIPPRELNPNVQLLGTNQWAHAQASSSNTSPQLLQALMMAQSQQQVPPRDNRHGVNLGRSITPIEALHGASSRGVHQRSVLLDAGTNKGVMPSPLQGRAINADGTSSYGTVHHILNSLSVVPQQLNASATSQQPEFLTSSAQTPANPLQGSTSNAWNVILAKDISSGQDGQGVNNCEVDKPETEDVDSFLSHNDDAADGTSNSFSTLQLTSVNNISGQKGFSFQEVSSFHLSKTKVLCCNFSSDGKYLASAGHEKKVLICNMDALSHVTTVEGHSNIITDVRFRPVSTVFATSSFDRTVQLWNAARTNKSLLTLHGHAEQVMSVDFHPIKQDFLCSCDSNNEIRLWDVNQNACTLIFKGASRQVRFQPRTGNLLAAASGNAVRLIDTETNTPQFKLEGHAKDVRSICWDLSGKYIASVSEDSARIWSIVSGGKCIYELPSNGNKFESCTFHPGYNQLLVIGAYQTLELWNPRESSNTVTVQAHDGMIASLAESSLTELIASASHDQCVKVWR